MVGPGSGFDYNDAPQLRMGDSGVWVAFLKEVLGETLGMAVSDGDHFDEATRDAVEAAQRVLDLPEDGVVDRTTWALLSSSLYLGDVRAYPTNIAADSEGRAVSFLQECLAAHGAYTGRVNGRFDRATRQALRAFHDDIGAVFGEQPESVSWLYLGMWAVSNQIPVSHELAEPGTRDATGYEAEAPQAEAGTDSNSLFDVAAIASPEIRSVVLSSIHEGVAHLEVVVRNPNPDAVQYVRVEILQEHQFNDETVDELAGNDTVSVTIAADSYTAADGRVGAFGQVRVAFLDPASGGWTPPIEQEFHVAIDGDGHPVDTGTGGSAGPHVTISRYEHDDHVAWSDGDTGTVVVRMTLRNDGESPAYDATVEVEQPASGGGTFESHIVHTALLDVGAEDVNEVSLTVPRQRQQVPFLVKVEWAATSGHGTEHSINNQQFFLNWTGDGDVTGIVAY